MSIRGIILAASDIYLIIRNVSSSRTLQRRTIRRAENFIFWCCRVQSQF